MAVLFDPMAEREFADSAGYYEAQEAGLGERFRRATWAAIRLIERYPQAGELVRPGVRKVLEPRFPDKLIDAIDQDDIYLIAVAHGHRRPQYWVDRVPADG